MESALPLIYVLATATAMFCLFFEICKWHLNVAEVSFFTAMFEALKKWLGWGPPPGPPQFRDHRVLSDQIAPMAASQLHCMCSSCILSASDFQYRFMFFSDGYPELRVQGNVLCII